MSSKEEQFRKTVTELRVAIAAVDVALFTILENSLHVFLIPVHRPPHYTNSFGLPGGVIGVKENADKAAVRHLKEKAHIEGAHIEQLYTFSDPERDKRSRSISVAYVAFAPSDQLSIGDKTEGKWFSIKKLPKLAYDHSEIIKIAVERLKGKLAYTNIVANLLPKQFTLTELQSAYEVILDRKLDKRNFRKKMLSIDLVKEVGRQKKTIHRPAQLYNFSKKGLATIPEVRAVL
jgi:8-oxo-dGTP diphosphatase